MKLHFTEEEYIHISWVLELALVNAFTEEDIIIIKGLIRKFNNERYSRVIKITAQDMAHIFEEKVEE